jgi:hypothetical protein
MALLDKFLQITTNFFTRNEKTILETAGYRVLCEMMNRRWNADNWIIYKNA